MQVLGLRFSMVPALGLQFAGAPTWARRPGQRAAGSAEELVDRLKKHVGQQSPTESVYKTKEEPVAAPAAAPPPVAAKPAAAPPPPEVTDKARSNVYTRALGSESPKATAGYAKRQLMPDEQEAIDAWVAEHKGKTGSNYVNPMAVALQVDAPVHRIAHYLESQHGLSTVPGEDRSPFVPKGAYQRGKAQEPGAEGATEHVNPGDFESWLSNYAMRQAAHDSRYHGMAPETTPVQEEKAPEVDDAAAMQKAADRVAGARKLAEYARGGVISREKAHQGVRKLSLDQGLQIHAKLLGWS